jgi:3-keto-disaccharide hydrolase/zinc-ribbon domain
MQCPNCGAPIRDEDRVCGECGTPLSKVDVPGEPPESPRLEELPPETTEPAQTLPPPAASRRKKAAVLRVGMVVLLVVAMGAGVFLSSEKWQPATRLLVGEPEARVLLYADDFSDSTSGWETTSDSDGSVAYLDGEYRVVVYNANSVVWSNPATTRQFLNFEIEVEARQVEGPLNSNYGVLVHYQEDERFYWFQVSSDGHFTVALRQADGWKQLVDWQASSAIHQGMNTINRLKVICIGDRYSFYINGVRVTDVTDDTLSGGNIGLAAGTFGEPGVTVSFDNLGVFEATE